MALTLRQLQLASAARQLVWDPEKKLTALYHSNELGGEAGEAQNEVKKLERERLGLRGSRTTVGKLAEELADVVICADLVAQKYGIDLGEAVIAKFNATSQKLGLNVLLSADDNVPHGYESSEPGFEDAGCKHCGEFANHANHTWDGKITTS